MNTLTEKADSANLIGKQFKRDKYGLSSWTETITNTFKVYTGNKTYYTMIRGEKNRFAYSLDEIKIL
jgi:hypothetical protein